MDFSVVLTVILLRSGDLIMDCSADVHSVS